MDPIENLREQLAIARAIQQAWDGGEEPDAADCARLAELVIALDAWMHAGGFSPWVVDRKIRARIEGL